MNQKRVIGLSGVARAGKDTFASILENKLKAKGKSVLKIALATPLKADCDSFLQERLGVSAFTQVPEEKLLIRPMLVWYGDAQRKRTNGRYWIDKAQAIINGSSYDYYIVTDVRYAHYATDEIHWLKNECKGVVCHISRFETEEVDITSHEGITNREYVKKFIQPANDHEAENDPKVKALADYCVEWKHVKYLSPETMLPKDPSLNAHVDAFMEKFGY